MESNNTISRAQSVASDTAKVQQNSETTKDLAKKNCLLSYHSALIAGASVKAAHGVALLSELSSTEEPGCSELLRPAVCSFRTIASVLRRMEVYAASRRDLANAIQSYNDNDSITFISLAPSSESIPLRLAFIVASQWFCTVPWLSFLLCSFLHFPEIREGNPLQLFLCWFECLFHFFISH